MSFHLFLIRFLKRNRDDLPVDRSPPQLTTQKNAWEITNKSIVHSLYPFSPCWPCMYMTAKVDESRIHNAHLVALLTVKWEWMRLHTTKKKEQQQKKRCVCVLGAVTHTHNKECPTASCVLYTEKKKKTVEWENACVCVHKLMPLLCGTNHKRGAYM